MPTYLILVLATVAAAALFVLGMSLTLIIKGHHIRSEVADNPHMRRLGIKCAVRESLEEEKQFRPADDCLPFPCGPSSDCSSCER
ncbi:MAG: hypothetical protein LIO77_08075 [Rikenellaceae bacterium]|nr:hypothetical protein [Rikenellaceae bacterium]